MNKRYLVFLIVGVALGLFLHGLFTGRNASAKLVNVRSRNLEYQIETTARTVGDFLVEQKFEMSDLPGLDSEIKNGATIQILPEVAAEVVDGGSRQGFKTRAATVGDLIAEQGIALASTDRVTPGFGEFLFDGIRIEIDRIVDLEVTEVVDLPFNVVRQNDSSLYYGNEDVLTPGVLGRKQQTNRITYENGVEVRRVLLSQQTLEDPQDEVVRFGTKIEIQEYGIGKASWYAFKGCMCAAHPYYERGRYVRVTRQDTNKSIIVRINDWGPDQSIFPERIIDLDSVAFKQLAPLGAGTTMVKVELLRN